jgi:signal transduction histidine kinase
MSRSRSNRLHAIRVAAGATAIVAIAAICLAVVLNLVVTHRLRQGVDARLSERLVDTAKSDAGHGVPTASPLPSSVHHEGDLDDAPSFVWLVSPPGRVTPLTADAPILPAHRWGTNPINLPTGGSSFRFDAIPSRFGWLVAGESVGQIGRINSNLLIAEGLLGALLLVVTFAGSLMVGLRASAPIEEVRRRQSEFTADASHELRTPLSVIEAEVELTLSRNRDPAAYRETLRRVSTESARLRSIVNDLLWLARADGETPDDDAEESVDIGMAAEACVDRFSAIASAKGLDLRYEPDGKGSTFVRSHPDSIDRLLGVLVDNACNYAGAGGIVTVGVAQWGSHVRLTVDDSGPGIPDKDQRLIFDRFHRATDAAGGTGLGLAIADTVVRRSNGEWSIGRSQLGGAKFGVKWKQVHAPPARRISENEDHHDSSGRSSGNMGYDQGQTDSRPPERTTSS